MELSEDTLLGRVCAKMVEGGLITKEQLEVAETEAIKEKKPMKEIVSDIAVIGPDEMASFLEEHLDIPRVELADYAPEPEALGALSAEVAKEHGILPLFEIEGMLTVAMANPFDVFELDRLSTELGWSLEPALASPSDDVAEAIQERYSQIEEAGAPAAGAKTQVEAEALAEAETEAEAPGGEAEAAIEDLPAVEVTEPPAAGAIELDRLAVADDETVRTVISQIVSEAAAESATSVHLEPRKDEFHVLFRKGGELSVAASAAKALESRLVGKLLAMAGLAGSQGRGVRNGSLRLVVDDRERSVGISSCSTRAGERLVISLTEASDEPLALKELGMDEDDTYKLEFLLQQTNGLILIGGPVGAGKTTTLFSCLAAVTSPMKTVFAVTEGMEYSCEPINHVVLSSDPSYSLTAVLRSLPEQDMDVVGVDEVRGIEAASLLVKIAQSGTLALGTILARDSCAAPATLNWYGIEPVSLASALLGAVGQTRVRKICQDCKVEDSSEQAVKAMASLNGAKAYKGAGCKKCNGSGFRGSLVIFEVMVVEDELRAAVAADKPEGDIRKTAKAAGMSTMRQCGLRRVAEGLTSVEEVRQATRHGGA